MTLERKLAFKDRYVKELTQTLEIGDCEESPLFLDETENVIILDLTEEEWTKLFSAIMTGADLTYPSTSHQVVWSFLKGVTCAMNFCQRMIDCFQNDEDTREALIQALITELLVDPIQAESFVSAMRELGISTNSANFSIGSPNTELSGKVLGNCDDLELLYGQCLQFVSALNIIAEDVFAWLEVYTNDEELASMIADNIPAIGAIPASILETALWLQETIREAYESAYDTTSQEYWSCKLFCSVQEGDCNLTFEAVHEAYKTELISFSPPIYTDDLQTWLEWYVEQVTLSDNDIVGIMHLFIMTILERSSTIFGSTFRTIEIEVADANPIADECGCCTDETWTFDDDTTATVVLATGSTVDTTIWQSHAWTGGEVGSWRAGQHYFIEGSDPSRYGWIKIEVDPDCFYTGFSVELKTTITSGANDFNVSVRLYDTDTIPRLADNHFVEAYSTPPQPEYQTLGATFAPRKFPNGYFVIGWGTGALYSEKVIRIRDLTLYD